MKKRLQHGCFLVNVAKFLEQLFYRTPLVAASSRNNQNILDESNIGTCKIKENITVFLISLNFNRREKSDSKIRS